MGTKNNLNDVKIVSSKKYTGRSRVSDSASDLQKTISQYDDVMMNWLNTSDENKKKFMKDPVGCFKKVAAPGEEAVTMLSKAVPFESEERELYTETVKMRAYAAASAAADSLDGSISAHKWDIVSAIKLDKLNAILSIAYDAGILPDSFQSDVTITLLGISISISIKGTIAGLSVSGGTGEDIDIKIPVKSLSINANNQAVTCDVDLILTVNLECVETVREDQSTLYTYYLKLDDEAVKNATAQNVPENVSKLFGGAEVFAGILKQKILDAAKGARIKICEINSEDIKEQYKFLIPKSAKYYFKKFSNMGDSVLAILIQTVSAEQGVWTIDDNVIPDNCDGSLIIENQLFLKNVLLDQVASACNTTTDNLELRRLTNISGSPYELYNKASFDYKKVEGYTPKVTNVTISEYGGKLRIHMEAVVTPTAGINLKYYADGEYTASFKEGSKEQEFELNEISFESDHDLEIEWWVWTVAALAGVVTIFTTGPLVAAILGGISVGVTAIIGAIISGVAPSGLDASIFTSAAASVKWNYANIVSFQKVGLFGDIQLGVTIPIIDKK